MILVKNMATFPEDLDSIPSTHMGAPILGDLVSSYVIWPLALHSCGAQMHTCRRNIRTNTNNKILEKVSALSARLRRIFVLLSLNFRNLKRVARFQPLCVCVTCMLLDSMEVIVLFRVNRLFLVRIIQDYFNKFIHKYAQILRILLSLMPGIVNC